MIVAPARLRDADDYIAHLARHIFELSTSPVLYAPFEPGTRWKTEGKARQIAARWARPLDEVGWERSWIVRDEGRVIAHLDVGCDPKTITATLHRASLSMGVEGGYRRLGLGGKLMLAGLEWAKAQAQLEWLDLEVFKHNTIAHALYLKHGFKEVGVTPDRFRVAGKSIDDLHLVLRLR